MIPCTADTDCKDPVRSTCATTFLTQLYAKDTDARTANNLYCLQKNCQSGASSCSPGQSCLPLLVPAAAHAPDICVPNCDSAQNCPPNHVCFQKISGPANPAICIPGLLGFICETDINCLVGKCLTDGDPAASLNLCTVACNSDADCAIYDSNQGTFVCVSRSDGKSYCESPYSYRGNSCRTDDDCVRDDVRDTPPAYFQSPPEKPTDLGTCLRPRDARADCAPARRPRPDAASPSTRPTARRPPPASRDSSRSPAQTNANCVGDLELPRRGRSTRRRRLHRHLHDASARPTPTATPIAGRAGPVATAARRPASARRSSPAADVPRRQPVPVEELPDRADGGTVAAATCAEPTP